MVFGLHNPSSVHRGAELYPPWVSHNMLHIIVEKGHFCILYCTLCYIGGSFTAINFTAVEKKIKTNTNFSFH